ncbi:hypothetical protein IA54_005280 [Xanthomonas phaseoli pv. syngonii LMG 9055]|uniref:Uncharacterized protein n=1 Tax=Xanthomonas phaseoli pv. syngonii LMG 9055 TaxID=1437878 RepID=A0A1V9H9Q3_9XANT|nr:hypothetical protein IA54_005280 [Xanthomonas phaseoli pv. syngonii LMG 9055]
MHAALQRKCPLNSPRAAMRMHAATAVWWPRYSFRFYGTPTRAFICRPAVVALHTLALHALAGARCNAGDGVSLILQKNNAPRVTRSAPLLCRRRPAWCTMTQLIEPSAGKALAHHARRNVSASATTCVDVR